MRVPYIYTVWDQHFAGTLLRASFTTYITRTQTTSSNERPLCIFVLRLARPIRQPPTGASGVSLALGGRREAEEKGMTYVGKKDKRLYSTLMKPHYLFPRVRRRPPPQH